MEADYGAINKAIGAAEALIPKAAQTPEGRRLLDARNRVQADDPDLAAAYGSNDSSAFVALAKRCNADLKLGIPATFGRW